MADQYDPIVQDSEVAGTGYLFVGGQLDYPVPTCPQLQVQLGLGVPRGRVRDQW